YQTVAALQAGKDMKMGATSLDGNFALGDMTVAYVMGLDAKVVTGYTGVAPVVLSMEQGETMGMLMPISTAYASVVAGRIKPLFVVGTKRSDLYPDVPALSEIVSASGDKKTLLEVWDGLGQSYHTFATPGIPADRVKYLQETAAAVMADPTFQSEIDKISGYHVTTYINGKDLGEAVAKVAKLGADAKSTFDMLTQRYAATQ
ncbi:MAG: tripartite tricarboxylate transporter substrate-binding protein, partial [Chloroflexota bacterium]